MSAKPDTPITRKEMYLDVATGGSASLPEPVTIEEKYLAKIAGMTVDLPAPVPLKHKFLAKIAGMQVDVPTYTAGLPRIYAYLAKAAGQDVDVPQPITREEMYWFDYVSTPPTPSEQEYTGAVPVTFTANGQPLLDYLISGNTVQSGTPTPDNPIMPQGCGDLETVGIKAGQYKIPISSAGQTTPIYLGEVQTTRKIKRLVLTGEESITQHIVQNDIIGVRIPTPSSVLGASIVICSHYEGVLWPVYNGYRRYGIVASNPSSGNAIVYMSAPDSEHNTLSTFVQWIKDQYAAGTPVTVWYVLATPETAVVNEPLMKIGGYADTLSMEQAGVSVPTVAGSNTLDVLTSTKPSEVYIKYKGEPVSQLSMLSSPGTNAPEELSEEAEEIPEEEVPEEVPEEKEEETESITPETGEE